MNKRIEIFCCYARADRKLLDQLKIHLIPLKNEGLISLWADTNINAGTEWEREINEHLHTAEIILLLVSPKFMASEYCYSKEMMQAMKLNDDGEVDVIPIILRPTSWQRAPFGKLQVLPTNAIPITQWSDRDKALLDVEKGVRKVVEEWSITWERTDEEWVREAWTHNGLGRHEEALVACERAIKRNHTNANAHSNKGWALAGLRRYEAAVVACNKAINLGTRDANTYSNKSWALNELKRHGEALEASNEAIRLDPLNTYAYGNKAWALNALNRHEEALAASNEGIRLGPAYVYAYDQKRWALDTLGQHNEALTTMKEALAACDMAIQLNPTQAFLYIYKGWVLNTLGRYVEADEAYKKAKELGYGR